MCVCHWATVKSQINSWLILEFISLFPWEGIQLLLGQPCGSRPMASTLDLTQNDKLLKGLHTRRLRLITRANRILFRKMKSIHIYSKQRSVCVCVRESQMLNTHGHTCFYCTESANERRKCVFLLPGGVWLSAYTVCVCVCVCCCR